MRGYRHMFHLEARSKVVYRQKICITLETCFLSLFLHSPFINDYKDYQSWFKCSNRCIQCQQKGRVAFSLLLLCFFCSFCQGYVLLQLLGSFHYASLFYFFPFFFISSFLLIDNITTTKTVVDWTVSLIQAWRIFKLAAMNNSVSLWLRS